MSLTLLGIGSADDDGTGDKARAGGAKIIAAMALLNMMVGPFDTVCYPSGAGGAGADTATVQAATALMATGAHTVSGFSDPLGTGMTRFAGGTFFIDAPIMTAAAPTSKVRGFKLQGQASDLTVIVYAPTVAQPMCTNQRWQNVQMEGIGFLCSTAGCDFMQSQEQKGLTNIQYNAYRDCGFSGFQYVWMLTGGNNNSEWTWDRCAFGALSGGVLYTPGNVTATITGSTADIAVANSPLAFPLGATMSFSASLGNIAANTGYYVVNSTSTSIQISTTSGGSALVPSTSGTLTASAATDQFLNFGFHNTKYDPGTSNAFFISLAKGGSVSITGTFDVSGWAPTVDTYLISLLGNTHAQGVCNFKLDHLRIEHQSDHALLFHCQWPGGNVVWNCVDTSSQISSRTNTAIEYVLVEIGGGSGPNIKFANSNFLGCHRYTYDVGAFAHQSSIKYESVDVLQQPNAASFALFTSIGGNHGGAPQVRFDKNCRGSDITECMATDLNWQLSTCGTTDSKSVNFQGSNANAPVSGGFIQRNLPINGILKSITFDKQANAQSGAYAFNVQTTEGTPTVLATFSGSNAGALNAPATVFLNMAMTSDALRKLQVVETAGRSAAFNAFQFAAEYIG